MKEVTVDIIEHIGAFGKKGNKTLEVNFVSWCGKDPKIDIRAWDDNHEYPDRGITFTEEQAEGLYKVLKERYEK